MEEFKNVMAAKSTKELVKIIEHDFRNYNIEAVEAAKSVLEERNVDIETLDEIKEDLASSVVTKKTKKKSFNFSFGGNEIDKEILDAPNRIGINDIRNIRIIAGLIFIYFVYQCIASRSYFIYFDWYGTVVSITMLVTLLFITIGLWLGERFGWFLFVGFLIVMIITLINQTFWGLFGFYEIESLETFLDTISTSSVLYTFAKILVQILIMFVLLWYFFKDRIKKIFSISRSSSQRTILYSIAIAICMFLLSSILMN